MSNLQSTFLGIPIRNPIVVGSSGLTSHVKSIQDLEKAGAGAVVLKSVFEEEIYLEYKRALTELSAPDYSNQEFLDYYDYEIKKSTLLDYQKLVSEAKKSVSIPVIASINCMGASDWVSFAKKIEEAGADGLELNILKLPFSASSDSIAIEKSYFQIIESIREVVSLPIGVKISPYFTNLGAFIGRLAQLDIQGITLFNRFYNPDFDIESEKVVSGSIFSSENDYHNTLRWISIMSSRVKCDLSASTGIHTSQTVMKMLYAGASSTQVVSSIYELGPEQIARLLTGLEHWMKSKNYKSINDFKGRLSQGATSEPEHYERVQFMKYFSHHG